MTSFSCFKSSRELPAEWDQVCTDHPFLRRSFLHCLEETNPCGQRYYLSHGQLQPSLFITYQHRLNIFTYGIGRLSMNLTIVGVPCSVASSGFVVQEGAIEAFKRELSIIKGGLLILNSDLFDLTPCCIRGLTLPSCILSTNGMDYSSYIASMRSHYRYKVAKSIKLFNGVTSKVLADNSLFCQRHYRLYEQVFERSDFKLEKLPISFFQKSTSQITIFEKDKEPLGFCQTKLSGNTYHFLFGGLDYRTNNKFDTYFNMLIHMVQDGFECGVDIIDLGQTAEWVKMRLGCKLVPRYLFARHSNPLLNFAIKKSIGLLEYNSTLKEPRVYKRRKL